MKCYEKEVISIPASWGMDGIDSYGVYSCPLKKQYTYQPSLFIAFRPKGGVMTTLYKIKNVYTLMSDVNLIKNVGMDTEDRKRILAYLNDPKFMCVQNDKYTTQFYVLDLKHTIPLPPSGACAQGRSPQGIVYYYLSDMLDPNKCRKLKPMSAY